VWQRGCSKEALYGALPDSAATPFTEEKTMFARFIRDDQGQDLIEYLLLGSFIAIVALVGATALGTQLNNWYNAMGSWAGSASGQIS
jgi:Flp pilus assembly pilin Flp